MVLALLGSACTLESGRGFATLESVELHAHFEPGAEQGDDGAVLTDLGYVVKLQSIRVQLFALELVTLDHEAEPAAAGEHCHDECAETGDGEQLEPHAEGEEARAVATLPIERSVDALASEELFLTEVKPSRELPQAHLERAELGVGRIELDGSVSDGDLTIEIPLSVAVDLDAHLESELDVAIAHDGPEQLSLHAELSLERALFDGIEFGAAESFTLDDDDERAETLRSAILGALHLHVAPEGHP